MKNDQIQYDKKAPEVSEESGKPMLSRLVSLSALLLMSGQAYGYEFSYKGMIKPELVSANKAVASYGTAYSEVAPTHALRTDIYRGNPATPQETEFLESAASSFQAAQSRFSLHMSHEKVRTVIEFDFIDGEDGFTNQTAIQAQEPRLRLATIYYDYSDKVTFFGGQKWSTAAGIKSNGSYNWIGNSFRSGNSGFLAMEGGVTYKDSGWEFTGALTGRGRNSSAGGINANELGGIPGLAFDANYSFNKHKVGFAAHTAQMEFESEAGFVSGENQDANLFKVYTSLNFGDIKFAGEYYVGEALNNQNALGVAPAARINNDGSVRESFEESGFFAFVTWTPTPDDTIKVGYSSAEVDSSDRARLTQTELSKNSSAYVNYGRKVSEGFTAFVEVTNFNTEYGVDFEDFSTVVTRAGVVFKF